MKVSGDLFNIAEQFQGKPAEVSRSEAGKSFGDALANQLKFEGAPFPVEGANRPEIVERVISGGEIPPEWFQINGVVDSIDRYSEALGNPVYTLKDLEPLAADMEKQAQSLQSKLQEGGFGNLREVAEEALAQAKIAAIKFRRGDYL
jgi:hypothetical protein